MSVIDFIILIILAGFVWKGIKLGLIEAVGGIIGLFVGAFMAGQYYDEAAEMLSGFTFGSEIMANILGFLLVFILVNRAIALLFWIVDKIFHIIAIIPFLKTFNRLLGGIFGLIEGLLFIGIVVYFLSFAPFAGGLQENVAGSRFSGIFGTVGKIASPFIPDSIENWQESLPTVPDLPDGFNLDNLPLNNIGDLLQGDPDINLDVD